MIRIAKTTSKVVSIKWHTKEKDGAWDNGTDIDSFIIIPGVTTYNNIYTKDIWLVFDSHDSYIGVQFSNEPDLERFFIQLMREIKLNQITNVNVDVDTKTN